MNQQVINLESPAFLAGEVLMVGSVPFRDSAEGYSWLRGLPLRIAVRPQFPLAGKQFDMFGELGTSPNPIETGKR